MEVPGKLEQKSKKLPQYFAAVVAAINTVSAGCVFGWASPALPQLQGSTALRNDSTASPGDGITVEEGSLVGSLVAVGALVASLPAGQLANLLGRRRLTQAISVLFLVGWVVIAACGRQVLYLCLARFLHGMCMGIGSVVTPLYNEEISELSLRGSLGMMYQLAVCLGILWVYLAGAVMPYLWMNITSALPAALSFVMLFFIPESPVHLLIHGDDEKARAALSWLRGKGFDVEPELSAMHKLADRAKDTSSSEDFWQSTKSLSLRSFCSPTAKSLFIVAGLMSTRQLSGINALSFYAEDIISGSGAAMEASMAAALSALFQLLTILIMIFVAELVGRRVLLVASCWGSALSLFGLALGPPGWLPVICFTGYMTFFSVGLGPLPWFMMAELVPTESKFWVTGCVATINWFLMFVTSHFFVAMVQSIGTFSTYLGYAIINAFAGLVVMLFVPETKGKTLEIIRNELGGK